MNPFDSFEAFQANCTSPQATTSIDEDCVNGVYTINVDVTDMGDATSLTITNDLGAPDMPVTETGVVSFGPIPVGTVINLVLEHDQDSQCNVDLGAFKDTCPAPNDTIAGAIPITPSAPGTGCDTFTFSYDFGDGSVSDSGLNTSCDNENTGHDLFFSWTATSSALVWNDGDANPGIAIRQLDGTEIICESSFASEDTILSGWNVGDDLIIQIYDTYSGATNTSFCLEELTCAAPTDLALNETNVTSTSAEFTWTVSASEELGYDWVVMAEGEDPAVDTPIESGTTNPGDTAVTVTGLTAATVYDFYILSNCDANGLSDYEGPESFQTACETFVPDYLEDFSGFLPVCWEEAEDGDFATGPASYGSGAWTPDGFLNNRYSGAARINLSTTTRSEWLISPAFDLSVDGYEVVFDIGITAFTGSDNSAMGSDDEVYALYSLDGVTWTVLQTWEAGSEPSNTGETVAFDLSGITGANVKFAIYATDGDVNDSEDYNIFIDNFKVRTPLICPEVYDLSVSNITQTEAELTWTDNTEAVNGYVWRVFEEGEDPETATAVATGTTTAGEVTVTVTGLSANSSYDAYVQADCVADWLSYISSAVQFETAFGATIVTPGTTETIDHCYENDDFKEWLFESSDGSTLTIEFEQGTLETNYSGGTFDDLMIYDGNDDTGIVLYDSDNPISDAGELEGLIFVAESGMLYMTLDSDISGSCKYGSQTEIIFNVDAGTASNSDFFSDANFSYYPNPVESRFVINSTYELEQIVIYNMLGQEVREISPQSTEVSFDLSDVQAGVYLVKATVEGQVQTFRLIKE
ncbi:hypothetical protein CAP47_11285 [Psychroflexus sp. S27]|nr:hypothetical protein CAP47_11285 [Psychroflexus sp. S27]